MLSDSDWIKLLEYLLNRLAEINALDVVMEIRETIASRVIEEVEENSDFNLPLLSNEYTESLNDKKILRSRQLSPKEAFIKSIEVIQMRLEVLPQIGEKISQLLLHDPSNILWKTDEKESQEFLHLAGIEKFSCSDLISSDNREESLIVLRKLLSLTKEVEK